MGVHSRVHVSEHREGAASKAGHRNMGCGTQQGSCDAIVGPAASCRHADKTRAGVIRYNTLLTLRRPCKSQICCDILATCS